MSIKLMSLILDGGVQFKTSTHKLTIICIADHADDNGIAYPSIRRLAHKVGVKDIRHVQRILRELEDEGMLATKVQAAHSPDGNPLQTNVYRILPPAYEGGVVYRPGGSTDRGEGGSTDQGGDGLQTTLTTNEPSKEPSLFDMPERPGKSEEKGKGKANRQRFAIQSSQEESARKKLDTMLGERYVYAQTLINKHGYKAETLYSRLASTPRILERFLELTTLKFDEILKAAQTEAARHATGWESQVGPQFLNLLMTTQPLTTLVNQTAQGSRLEALKARLTFLENSQGANTPNYVFEIDRIREQIAELEGGTHADTDTPK